MTEAPAVVVNGLSKSFRIPEEQTHTLKERALHPFRRSRHHRFEALKNATFEVPQGEFFGIVGRNGSGKSTLLKCLAGIYKADGGDAWIRGRLSAFIELGVGFNMDLPARDNIRLNAVMLGLTGGEARRRADEIIEFAGLEGFEDLKIKNYSSGMLVRLGFAIMIHVDAEVLLIDEVLAVGDAAFQQKCFDEFDRIRAEGRTVLFITHDMSAVQRYCDRAMLIEKGSVVGIGPPAEIAEQYLALNFADQRALKARQAPLADRDPERDGDGGAEIVDAYFLDSDGNPSGVLRAGETSDLVFTVHFHEDVPHPIFGVTIGDARHPTIMSLSTAHQEEWTGLYRKGMNATCRLHFHNDLDAGQYIVTPSVARHGADGNWLDRREGFVPLVVTNAHPTSGLVLPPHHFEVSWEYADADADAQAQPS